ncbi:hypothetical protein BDR05DRAFT_989091 [Suillus weaverae]|nr:hypothetical protein BDR05DRAFT_989091 [Suillus weaverae]
MPRYDGPYTILVKYNHLCNTRPSYILGDPVGPFSLASFAPLRRRYISATSFLRKLVIFVRPQTRTVKYPILQSPGTWFASWMTRSKNPSENESESFSACTCYVLHGMLVMIHIVFVMSYIFHWEHRVTLPFTPMNTDFWPVVLSASLQAFYTLYTAVLVFLTQRLAISRALIRRLKLTAIHDISGAWAGIGSALSSVWKQADIPASLWATTAVTAYLVCISVLHVTSSTLLQFQTFNSSMTTHTRAHWQLLWMTGQRKQAPLVKTGYQGREEAPSYALTLAVTGQFVDGTRVTKNATNASTPNGDHLIMQQPGTWFASWMTRSKNPSENESGSFSARTCYVLHGMLVMIHIVLVMSYISHWEHRVTLSFTPTNTDFWPVVLSASLQAFYTVPISNAGALQLLWLGRHSASVHEALQDVVDPTEDNLRRAGMVDVCFASTTSDEDLPMRSLIDNSLSVSAVDRDDGMSY